MYFWRKKMRSQCIIRHPKGSKHVRTSAKYTVTNGRVGKNILSHTLSTGYICNKHYLKAKKSLVDEERKKDVCLIVQDESMSIDYEQQYRQLLVSSGPLLDDNCCVIESMDVKILYIISHGEPKKIVFGSKEIGVNYFLECVSKRFKSLHWLHFACCSVLTAPTRCAFIQTGYNIDVDANPSMFLEFTLLGVVLDVAPSELLRVIVEFKRTSRHPLARYFVVVPPNPKLRQ